MEHSALFAKASYDMVKSGNKTKRIDGINKTIAHTGFTADSNLSNRDILYLKNNKTGEHHIAVRGTDASSRGLKKTQDIMTDLKFAMGKESHDKHFKKKINRINNLVKQTPEDAKITMSGHSLGGGVVTEALKSKKNIREKVSHTDTYNAAFSPFTKKASKAVQKSLKDDVVHHRTKYDAVSASSAVNNSVGTVVEHETKENKHIKHVPKVLEHAIESVQQLKHHTIDNFIDEEKQ
jgi:hypothetical protein